MAKTEQTIELEEYIYKYTEDLGVFGCAEVGLGDAGIVDFITIERGQVVRCYELKITKSDFLSTAKKTFIGEYNYYVIPSALYAKVQPFIEKGVGCICFDPDGHGRVAKKPSKQKCQLPKKYIMTRLFRALSRENGKNVTKSWYNRQTSKPIRDMGGAQLEAEDTVVWKGQEYTIDSFVYSQPKHSISDRARAIPYCALKRTASPDYGKKHGSPEASTKIVAKVRANDLKKKPRNHSF